MRRVDGNELRRARAILAAARTVTAGAGRDLDAVLDALADQARQLLGADEATVSLIGPDGRLILRRASRLAAPGSPFTRAGEPAVVDGVVEEALATRRVAVVTDFHADPRVGPAAKAALPSVASALIVPLVADGEVLGILVGRWTRPHAAGPDDVVAAELLAEHAASAVLAARLIEQERAARAAADGLAEAARLVAAGTDLDATLDALTAQVRRLLGADTVAVYLAEGDDLVVRRPSPMARPGSAYATPGARVRPGPFTAEAIRRGTPVLSDDYQADPRATPEGRSAFPLARASMAVPLHAGDELIGVLRVDWARPGPVGESRVAASEAFARHAALAVRTARLLEAERRSSAELSAVLDAVGDVLVVYAADGQLLHANRRARERLIAGSGGIPGTLAEFRDRMRPRREDGELLTDTHLDRALRGEVAEAEVALPGPAGATRRVHVTFGPVREHGQVRAVVIVARDFTALHEAIAGQARFEGAVAAARTVAHELNNRLQKLSGYAELLPDMGPAEAGEVLAEMVEDVAAIGRTVTRLQRIVRFEGTDTPVGPALDLEAASRPAG